MKLNPTRPWLGLAVATALWLPAIGAAELAPAPDEALLAEEVTRDAVQLRATLSPRPDVDVINTALVFHNPRYAPTVVVCAGFDANGNLLRRARTRVPANGLRFLLASDLSHGVDFIGTARCRSRDRVVPSAFIVGPALTDAPARVVHGWDGTDIRFPVVTSY